MDKVIILQSELDKLEEARLLLFKIIGNNTFQIYRITHGVSDIMYRMSHRKYPVFAEPIWQDQPTEDGYYWLKDDDSGHPDDLKIVEVYWFNETLYDPAIRYCGTDCDDNLIDITGKWYGPITPPKED